MLRLCYLHIAALSEERELSRLSQYRREKLQRCRFPQDRLRSLGAGLALDHALREFGLREAQMEYETGPFGKPMFRNAPELHFNLSHSGFWVLCALSDGPVGCDVEQIRPARLAVAERFFAPEETEALRAAPEKERSVLFFRLWTLKESVLKAMGKGLQLPLNSFCVRLSDPVRMEGMDGGWTLTELPDLLPDACAACCTAKPEPKPRLDCITPFFA